jgi:hypothetical protein
MKNATQVLVVITAMAAFLGSRAAARATEQVRDHVRFEGKNQLMLECPLGDLLARLPASIEFEWQTTANWKGYTAGWEVKDGGLFLVSFEGKRGGKVVPVEAILPGRKLPVRADWYTGRARILIDEPIVRGPGLYGSVFERVVDLRIVKGRVVEARELRKARIKSPSEEREAERARHCLWPFPRLERGTVHAASFPARYKVSFITVPPDALRRTPGWPKEAAEPPLSPLKAMLLAEAKSRELIQPPAKCNWDLSHACLTRWSEGRYYYEFVFLPKPREAVSSRDPPYLRLLVLMDGTVPVPEVWDAAGWIPAAYAGAFDVDEPRPETAPARWEDPDQGAPWSEISGRVRLSLLGAIAAAPKLLYDVEKLEVYPNGVWAEYSVTNGSDRRKFHSPGRLHVPVRNSSLWDAAGEKWRVPRPKEDTGSGRPQEFIAIDARQTVRYRVLISKPVDKPLQPFGLIEDRPPGRPAALEYFIAAWPTAYNRLTESGESEVQVFAFGYGRVPVKWFDKPYPADWPVQTRILEPRATK